MENEISKASETLRKDGTILYPTDTIWGIGCDATSNNAVLKIYKIKKRDLNKPLICLASSYEMISEYVDFMPNFNFTGLSKGRPTTFIFDSPKGISNYITKYSKSIGFRVPNNDFCKKLISEFGKPIVSTSANLSEDKAPSIFEEINVAIKESVDYIVDYQKDKNDSLPSRLIKLDNDGSFEIIR